MWTGDQVVHEHWPLHQEAQWLTIDFGGWRLVHYSHYWSTHGSSVCSLSFRPPASYVALHLEQVATFSFWPNKDHNSFSVYNRKMSCLPAGQQLSDFVATKPAGEKPGAHSIEFNAFLGILKKALSSTSGLISTFLMQKFECVLLHPLVAKSGCFPKRHFSLWWTRLQTCTQTGEYMLSVA